MILFLQISKDPSMKQTLLYLRTIILSLTIATASAVTLSGCVGLAAAAAATAGIVGGYKFNQNYEIKKRNNTTKKHQNEVNNPNKSTKK